MFIHLGGDVIIRSKEIIAILDRDAEDMSMVTKTYLEQEKAKKKVQIISVDYIKSIVVTDQLIYLSPVSSMTLNKRSQSVLANEVMMNLEEE